MNSVWNNNNNKISLLLFYRAVAAARKKTAPTEGCFYDRSLEHCSKNGKLHLAMPKETDTCRDTFEVAFGSKHSCSYSHFLQGMGCGLIFVTRVGFGSCGYRRLSTYPPNKLLSSIICSVIALMGFAHLFVF